MGKGMAAAQVLCIYKLSYCIPNTVCFSPRPYYPFSYIWSREFAATKIQAAMRGYWVRRTDAVQEMRQFWKALAMEREFMKKSLENVNTV